VRLRPCFADAFTGMGVVLKELKRRPEAEACFEAVVRLRPACALAHGNLAGTSVAAGVHTSAMLCLEIWQGLHPFGEALNSPAGMLSEHML
jgi:Flp pilus assembly protein TadD